MNIVIWNCNMALHTKLDALMSLEPDLAILPESAEPNIVQKKAPNFIFHDADWIGHSKHKGLGVYSFSKLSFKRHSSFDDMYELFLPLSVSGNANFNLIAIWAFNHRTKNKRLKSPAPTRSAIQYYKSFIRQKSTVLAGDFNHNVFWDKPGCKSNFSCIVDELNNSGKVSSYHKFADNDFGRETDPTFIWQRKRNQPYHIDYCFISEAWSKHVSRVTVGSPDDWLDHSDHMPLVIELDI